MFKVGDWVIYGGKGVCKVLDIGKPNITGISRDRDYYTLLPRNSAESRIFTPVDNQKVIIRPVISGEEAMKLIDDIQSVETLWITDEKRRENDYKDALKSCECRQLVKIIKTIYLRKQSRLAEGKKMTAGDEKYFRIAEENLYSELAVALNMDEKDVRDFIVERVHQKTK